MADQYPNLASLVAAMRAAVPTETYVVNTSDVIPLRGDYKPTPPGLWFYMIFQDLLLAFDTDKKSDEECYETVRRFLNSITGIDLTSYPQTSGFVFGLLTHLLTGGTREAAVDALDAFGIYLNRLVGRAYAEVAASGNHIYPNPPHTKPNIRRRVAIVATRARDAVTRVKLTWYPFNIIVYANLLNIEKSRTLVASFIAKLPLTVQQHHSFTGKIISAWPDWVTTADTVAVSEPPLDAPVGRISFDSGNIGNRIDIKYGEEVVDGRLDPAVLGEIPSQYHGHLMRVGQAVWQHKEQPNPGVWLKVELDV